MEQLKNNKFSNETLNTLFNFDIDSSFKEYVNIPKINDNRYIISNKQYLLLENNNYDIKTLINKSQYITNKNNEKYELIGIYLSDKEHTICFVKTKQLEWYR